MHYALCTMYYVLCTIIVPLWTMHALCTMHLLNFFQSNVRTDRHTDRLCVVTICAQGCFTKTPFLEIHVAQSWFLVLPPNLKLWPNLILPIFPIVIDMVGWGGEGDTFGKNRVSIGPRTKNQLYAIWLSKNWFLWNGLMCTRTHKQTPCCHYI